MVFILNSIAEWLQNNPLIIESDEKDGRIASAVTEKDVVNALINAGFNISEAPPRHVKDFIVNDDDDIICNLKLIDFPDHNNAGGPDCFRAGSAIGYAILGYTHPATKGMMNWSKAYDIVTKYSPTNNPNFWYLAINKLNTSQVVLRELGEFNDSSLYINPSNCFQFNFKNELDLGPYNRTVTERYDWLMDKWAEFAKLHTSDFHKWLERK